MIDLPAFSTFLATLESERFLLAVGVALLAGIVRGFSGFGSALIYVPLVSALYEPKIATVSCALMDYICVLPYALRAFRHANWHEVLPAFAAALLTVPLGTHVQAAVDPTVLRWGMSIFVLGFVVLLASGWRYPFKPNTPAAMGAGALSGFAGGALLAGLLFGWLRSVHPTFGRIPSSTVWFMNSVGLNVFIAVVGISAGPGFVEGLQQLGASLFLWGLFTTTIPLIIGILIGRYIFRFDPAILFGCCAGARTTTAALGMICESAESDVPGLGYTVTYAVGNTLLTIWGMVIIMLLA